MELYKKILYILLAILIFTIVMIVCIGKNGLFEREQKNYNQTHAEEMEDKENKVIINNN